MYRPQEYENAKRRALESVRKSDEYATASRVLLSSVVIGEAIVCLAEQVNLVAENLEKIASKLRQQ